MMDLSQSQLYFENFLKECDELLENDSEVINLLRKRYRRAKDSFVQSLEFRNKTEKVLFDMKQNASDKFSFLKDYVLELKAYDSAKSKKPVRRIELTHEVDENEPSAKKCKVDNQKQSRTSPLRSVACNAKDQNSTVEVIGDENGAEVEDGEDDEDDDDDDEEDENDIEDEDESDSQSNEEDSDCDKNQKQKGGKQDIKRLESLLGKIDKKIRRLQEKELTLEDMDDEDSDYLLEDAYRRKFVKVWEKLCELKERMPSTGRASEKRFIFNETKYPDINKKIEKFVNKKKAFPDYQDVVAIMRHCNKRHNLGLNAKKIDFISQDAFAAMGNKLQKRRLADFKENFGCHLTDSVRPDEDPALRDKELRKTLEANQSTGRTKMKEIIEKYAHKQMKESHESSTSSEDEDEDVNDKELEIDKLVDQELSGDSDYENSGERGNKTSKKTSPKSKNKDSENQVQEKVNACSDQKDVVVEIIQNGIVHDVTDLDSCDPSPSTNDILLSGSVVGTFPDEISKTTSFPILRDILKSNVADINSNSPKEIVHEVDSSSDEISQTASFPFLSEICKSDVSNHNSNSPKEIVHEVDTSSDEISKTSSFPFLSEKFKSDLANNNSNSRKEIIHQEDTSSDKILKTTSFPLLSNMCKSDEAKHNSNSQKESLHDIVILDDLPTIIEIPCTNDSLSNMSSSSNENPIISINLPVKAMECTNLVEYLKETVTHKKDLPKSCDQDTSLESTRHDDLQSSEVIELTSNSTDLSEETSKNLNNSIKKDITNSNLLEKTCNDSNLISNEHCLAENVNKKDKCETDKAQRDKKLLLNSYVKNILMDADLLKNSQSKDILCSKISEDVPNKQDCNDKKKIKESKKHNLEITKDFKKVAQNMATIAIKRVRNEDQNESWKKHVQKGSLKNGKFVFEKISCSPKKLSSSGCASLSLKKIVAASQNASPEKNSRTENKGREKLIRRSGAEEIIILSDSE